MMDRQKVWPKYCLAVSVLLFLASLPFTAYYYQTDGSSDTRPGLPGLMLLLLGWLGLYGGMVAWAANPALIWSWHCLRESLRPQPTDIRPVDRDRHKKLRDEGVLYSVLAVILGLSFLVHEQIPTGSAGFSKITGYGPGYFLWIASILAALIGNIFCARS
jgi:hypothetical protein